MGGKSSPAAPDYTGAAKEQSAASKELTTQQTWANRPTLTTPWGEQTWSSSQTLDPATGQPVTKWASNIALSPQQQQALDSQMRVQTGRSVAAEALLQNAMQGFGVNLPQSSYSTPSDSTAAGTQTSSKGADAATPDPATPSSPAAATSGPSQIDYSGISAGADRITLPAGGGQDWRGAAQTAALDFNRPMQQERRAAAETQLTNMGLNRGTAAWDREMRNLGDQETRDNMQVFDQGRQEAQLMGNQDAQKLGMQVQAGSFNQQLRQQEIAELLARRSQPLNELNALLTGQQVASPNMPTFNTAGKAETPQLMAAAQNQYSAALDASNAENAGFSNMMSGAVGLGSAAMGAGGWGALFGM